MHADASTRGSSYALLGHSPEYPPIIYSEGLQTLSESPATPSPYDQARAGAGVPLPLPATSSIVERMAPGPPPAAAAAEPELLQWGNTTSPFLNAAFQVPLAPHTAQPPLPTAL